MFDLQTIVTVLSSLSFVGHFEKPVNNSIYFCACAINSSTNYIHFDSESLLVGVLQFNSSYIHLNTSQNCQEENGLTTPTAQNPTSYTENMTYAQVDWSSTTPNFTSARYLTNYTYETESLLYTECEPNKLYQYLSACAAFFLFAFGLVLRPDIIWQSTKRYFQEQYHGNVSEPRIRNQLRTRVMCAPQVV